MSQFYGKMAEAKCVSTTSTRYTRMNSGRKCLYPYTCNTRECDTATNTCNGKPVGDSCSSHMECDSNLSCRVATVWPFGTTCQPRGEVRSLCESDYDCKMRNYCWQEADGKDKICLEKHNAPYGTQFYWDSKSYPVVNKESVLFHGLFCQSGYAMRRNTTIAECVDIYNIT